MWMSELSSFNFCEYSLTLHYLLPYRQTYSTLPLQRRVVVVVVAHCIPNSRCVPRIAHHHPARFLMLLNSSLHNPPPQPLPQPLRSLLNPPLSLSLFLRRVPASNLEPIRQVRVALAGVWDFLAGEPEGEPPTFTPRQHGRTGY